MQSYDPLLELEQVQKKSKKIHFFARSIKAIGIYLVLTGVIFGTLVGLLNISAYSARVMHWINPAALASIQENVQNLISNQSMQVHASESAFLEQQEDLETVKSKLLDSNPEIIYSQSYSPRDITSNVDTGKKTATFSVTPYENRIIIPKIGKNIPLIDVHMQEDVSFDTMHEVFMEELKKGVVRYPGTARPGETGNAFIFGHSSNFPWVKSNYNDVFALLDHLSEGDEIIIYYNQQKYTYTVTDRAVVKPGDVEALEARDPTRKELSLMTCWPIGTTLERLIIFAELTKTE